MIHGISKNSFQNLYFETIYLKISFLIPCVLIASCACCHNGRYESDDTKLIWTYSGSLILWAFYVPFQSRRRAEDVKQTLWRQIPKVQCRKYQGFIIGNHSEWVPSTCHLLFSLPSEHFTEGYLSKFCRNSLSPPSWPQYQCIIAS